MDESTVVSPWFSVSTILKFVFFVILGVALPWLLSEGALEVPIIRSKFTRGCADSQYGIGERLSYLPKAESIFHQCLNKLDQGCDSQFHLMRPNISERRLEDCLFSPAICYNDTRGLEMTHWNITPYELGINSKATIWLTHRLTCMPIDIIPFAIISTFRNFSIVTAQDRPTALPPGAPYRSLSQLLQTQNGLNPASTKSSGLKGAQNHSTPDITLPPRFIRGSRDCPWRNSTILNPYLRRRDGRLFLVVYRSGYMRHNQKIDDPVFSAH